jgi:hypothetical protein
MSILFMDGFDQLRDVSGAGNPSPLATYLNASGYTVTGVVSMEEGRTQAVRALQLTNTASLSRTFTSAQSKVVIGFAYNAASKRSAVVNIPNVGTLDWDTETGKMSLANGTGTATILLGLWYYFEIVIDKANQLLQLYINNGKDIEVALPATAINLSTFACTWSGTAAETKKIDDIFVVDSSTGKYVDRVGPIAIQCRLPTSDVDKEWSPSTGTDHWDLVNNQPPDETQYIQSNTSGAEDSFLSNDGLPSGAQVIAVGLVVLNKKSDIDARQLGMVVGRKGQPQKQVLDTNLTTTPKYSYAVFESAPGDAAWTDETVTSIPFGVVVRP